MTKKEAFQDAVEKYRKDNNINIDVVIANNMGNHIEVTDYLLSLARVNHVIKTEGVIPYEKRSEKSKRVCTKLHKATMRLHAVNDKR